MCGFITTTNHHGLQNGVGNNKKTEDQDNWQGESLYFVQISQMNNQGERVKH